MVLLARHHKPSNEVVQCANRSGREPLCGAVDGATAGYMDHRLEICMTLCVFGGPCKLRGEDVKFFKDCCNHFSSELDHLLEEIFHWVERIYNNHPHGHLPRK